MLIRILFNCLEVIDNNSKFLIINNIYKSISLSLENSEFNMESLFKNIFNSNFGELDVIKNVYIYFETILLTAKFGKISAESVFKYFEIMKKYPEIKELVAEFDRKVAELEVRQKHEQEAKAI